MVLMRGSAMLREYHPGVSIFFPDRDVLDGKGVDSRSRQRHRYQIRTHITTKSCVIHAFTPCYPPPLVPPPALHSLHSPSLSPFPFSLSNLEPHRVNRVSQSYRRTNDYHQNWCFVLSRHPKCCLLFWL